LLDAPEDLAKQVLRHKHTRLHSNLVFYEVRVLVASLV